MASLTLHNVPQKLIEQLEQRATTQQSSVEDVALKALEQVYGTSPENATFVEKLNAFLQEPRDEQWDDDPFEDVRVHESGREENPWED